MNSSRETKLLKWESKCSSKWLKDIILDMENKHFTVNHITWFIEQWNKWTFDEQETIYYAKCISDKTRSFNVEILESIIYENIKHIEIIDNMLDINDEEIYKLLMHTNI